MPEKTARSSSNPDMEEARKHFKAAREEIRESIKSLLPAGYIERRRAARKEFLLGMRKLIDIAIERNESKAKQA